MSGRPRAFSEPNGYWRWRGALTGRSAPRPTAMAVESSSTLKSPIGTGGLWKVVEYLEAVRPGTGTVQTRQAFRIQLEGRRRLLETTGCRARKRSTARTSIRAVRRDMGRGHQRRPGTEHAVESTRQGPSRPMSDRRTRASGRRGWTGTSWKASGTVRAGTVRGPPAVVRRATSLRAGSQSQRPMDGRRSAKRGGPECRRLRARR